MNKLGLLLTGIAALTAGVGVAMLKKNRIDVLEDGVELEEETDDVQS